MNLWIGLSVFFSFVFSFAEQHSKMEKQLQRFLMLPSPQTSIASLIINNHHQSGTFGVISEVILIHHHPIIVYFRIHSWCYTVGFWQMYSSIYSSVKYNEEYFYCTENSCDLPVHPSHYPQPLANAGLFTVSIVLLFQECHVVGTIYYVAFSN